MLLFSTILEIKPSLSKEAFIQLVIEWNQNSPHVSNIIPNLAWNGERNIRWGNDTVWMEIVEYRNQNIIAVRYEIKEENGAVWDSDYIMNFSSMKMSIRLDRSFIQDALNINPKFSTPHFITLLIEHGYLKDDGNFPINRDPIIINDSNIHNLADIINEEAVYRLPVVFISKTHVNDNPVDISLLASKLKGVAHVLVQQSNEQNRKLMELCNRKNEYYGAIGIYYPNRAVRHKKFLYRSIGQDSFLLEKVARAVIQYNNSQQIDILYTWQGVNNALLRDRLISQREERIAAEQAMKQAEKEYLRLMDAKDEEQKQFKKKAMEDARADAELLIEQFDADMARLQRQVEELTRQNEALQYENQGLHSKLQDSGSIPLLFMGDEHDFFQGEIKDLILSVLSDSINNLQPKSRRSDVVKDIIRNNNYRKCSTERAAKVKAVLKNYSGMTNKVRQVLEEMGFVLSGDGKHIKAVYYGDGRYILTLAKTPSDHRSGKNDASDGAKVCF